MKKLIVANWKMNPSELKEAKRLFNKTKQAAARLTKTEVVICPPFIYLSEFGSRASKLKLGAQDVSFFDFDGAHTGEISAKMLKNIGAKYAIIGHSERRKLGETNEIINKKIGIALSSGLKAILCVGEESRDNDGRFLGFIREELSAGLRCLSRHLIKNLIVAYEPAWAISGRSGAGADNPDDVFKITVLIRKILMDFAGNDLSRNLPIIYGGSVNSENIAGFLKKSQVSGLLVGGKSLDSEEFGKIIKIADQS